MIVKKFKFLILFFTYFACLISSKCIYAQDNAPVITPSEDSDVTYELTSLLGDATSHQRMRWQVETSRQRLDPLESKIYMITSWKDRQLTVVDMNRRRFSVMPTPGTEMLSPPGKPAQQGHYIEFGHDMVSGEDCDLWRTSDTDGRPVDVCYTKDGILLSVWVEGRRTVRAQHISRIRQNDEIFQIPKNFKQEAPDKP